ncbi:MAG: helix-turn-helix domain-containing protein [Cellvibrionaceae bacterium]|nr:helix-turn-helix domain-containing protein [Cellvibrionaceae bacterium]
MSEISSKNAPKKCNRLNIKEANDADLHAGNLSNWSQEYNQTSCGSFHGEIAELGFEGLQVFRESTNRALQQKCLVWPNSLWMGIPLANQPTSRINGVRVESQQIMCRPGNESFELSTPDDYSLYGMVIDQRTLFDFAATHKIALNWTEIASQGRLAIPAPTMNNIRFVLNRLLCRELSPLQCDKLSRDLLMMCILELIAQEKPEPIKQPSHKRKKHTVDTARSYIAGNVGEAITITDLCRHTSVSQRTLHYSFESILGISPIHYLRITRLNEVRRRLSHCDESQNIFDIASQWGFWHMSQFAKDYKNLFAEYPSETKAKYVKHH